jgi:hypothetical protein
MKDLFLGQDPFLTINHEEDEEESDKNLPECSKTETTDYGVEIFKETRVPNPSAQRHPDRSPVVTTSAYD